MNSQQTNKISDNEKAIDLEYFFDLRHSAYQTQHQSLSDLEKLWSRLKLNDCKQVLISGKPNRHVCFGVHKIH